MGNAPTAEEKPEAETFADAGDDHAVSEHGDTASEAFTDFGDEIKSSVSATEVVPVPPAEDETPTCLAQVGAANGVGVRELSLLMRMRVASAPDHRLWEELPSLRGVFQSNGGCALRRVRRACRAGFKDVRAPGRYWPFCHSLDRKRAPPRG